MTRAASISQLRPEFDSFLRAPIGDDKNGMLLSVLSALARQNIDPWREAAELSRLPRETAVRRLASLIAALPEEAPSHQDPKTVAARLVALLPRVVGFEPPARTSSPAESVMINLRWSLPYIMIFFLAVILGAQLFAAADRSPAPALGAHAIGPETPRTPSGNHGP